MSSALPSLKGTIALITGANQPFARLCARALAKQGAQVVLQASQQEALDHAVTSLQRDGCQALGLRVDSTDQESIAQAFDDIERNLGPVSLLLNHAENRWPIGKAWIADGDPEWRVVDTHMLGSHAWCEQALTRMSLHGTGRIINSLQMVGAQQGFPSAFTVAKFKLTGFTEDLAVRAAPRGVRTFAFYPGLIDNSGLLTDLMTPCPVTGSSMQGARREMDGSQKGVGRVLELAAGCYDALNGQYLTIYDDLYAMECAERQSYAQALNAWLLKRNDSK